MIDHVVLDVRDYSASKRFNEQALAPLDYEIVLEIGSGCGFGRMGKPGFWVAERGSPQTGVHVAFASPDRATVDRFYDAAIAAGGADNGRPGLRPHYHEETLKNATARCAQRRPLTTREADTHST